MTNTDLLRRAAWLLHEHADATDLAAALRVARSVLREDGA